MSLYRQNITFFAKEFPYRISWKSDSLDPHNRSRTDKKKHEYRGFFNRPQIEVRIVKWNEQQIFWEVLICN